MNDDPNTARPENVIILRDGEKHNRGMGFVMKPAIRRLRDDVERYNEFVDKHDILNGLQKRTAKNAFGGRIPVEGYWRRTFDSPAGL
jgi:hypothetical protein